MKLTAFQVAAVQNAINQAYNNVLKIEAGQQPAQFNPLKYEEFQSNGQRVPAVLRENTGSIFGIPNQDNSSGEESRRHGARALEL